MRALRGSDDALRDGRQITSRMDEVQAAVLADMEYWLKRGVDGFRLDTVFMYFKDKELRDNPPADCDPRRLLLSTANK